MGEMGTIAKVNEFGFKVMGLSWLTGLIEDMHIM